MLLRSVLGGILGFLLRLTSFRPLTETFTETGGGENFYIYKRSSHLLPVLQFYFRSVRVLLKRSAKLSESIYNP